MNTIYLNSGNYNNTRSKAYVTLLVQQVYKYVFEKVYCSAISE